MDLPKACSFFIAAMCAFVSIQTIYSSEPMPTIWMTGKQRADRAKGEKNGRALLTVTEVEEIKQLRYYVTQRELAEAYGVVKGTIEAIQYGRNWKGTMP